MTQWSPWRWRLVAVLAAMACAACIAQAGAPSPAERARQILAATGVRGGLVVHFGCGDGTLTAALRANDSYLVHGLDADPKNVAAARAHIQALGLYGKVTVQKWDGRHLPYIDNLVNLIVSERPVEVSEDELMRVLAPGAVAYIKQAGRWNKKIKPWPEDIDQWTHYLHDATNNAVAHDKVVGPPRRLQWVGSPRWARHHDRMSSINAVVSSGGRVFYIMDEGSRASILLPPRTSRGTGIPWKERTTCRLISNRCSQGLR